MHLKFDEKGDRQKLEEQIGVVVSAENANFIKLESISLINP